MVRRRKGENSHESLSAVYKIHAPVPQIAQMIWVINTMGHQAPPKALPSEQYLHKTTDGPQLSVDDRVDLWIKVVPHWYIRLGPNNIGQDRKLYKAQLAIDLRITISSTLHVIQVRHGLRND